MHGVVPAGEPAIGRRHRARYPVVNYHETIMAPSGQAAEKSLRDTVVNDGQDFADGFRAFLAKRPPNFSRPPRTDRAVRPE